MTCDVDTSIVTSESFQQKVARKGEITHKLKALSKEYIALAYENIQVCNHPFVRVSGHEGRFPYHKNDMAVCTSCGLALNGQSGFAPDVPFINFRDSTIVFNDAKVPLREIVEYRLSVEMQYALQYPKRFTPDYLKSMFEDSPFDSQKILELDERNYVVISDELIDSYDSFRSHYYSN
jgi:hypothetical protein